MKKLLYLILLIATGASAQTRQTGGISFTPQWNYKISGSDTTWQFGNTLMSPQQFPYFLTKWQSDQRYVTTAVGGYKLKNDTVNAQGYARNWQLTNLLALKANLAGGNAFTGNQTISSGGADGVYFGYGATFGGFGRIWANSIASKSNSNFGLTLADGYTELNAGTSAGQVDLEIAGAQKVSVTNDTTYMLNKVKISDAPNKNDMPLRYQDTTLYINPAHFNGLIGTGVQTALNNKAPATGGTGYIQNKYGSTTVQSNSKIIVTDTIRTQGNVNVQPVNAIGKYNVYGNSIQYGTGTSLPITTTQAYRIANGLHLTINNQAVPGSYITNMLTTLWSSILSYNSTTDPYISTLYGTNEALPSSGISTSQYRAYYNALIDSLHTLKGYPYNKIIIMGMPYTGSFATDPRPNAEAYAAIDSIVAAEKGTLFVENFHWMQAQGGRQTMLTSDGVHLSDIGNASMAAHALSISGFTLDGNVMASNNVVSALNITAPHADFGTMDISGIKATQVTGANGNFTTARISTATIGTIVDSVIIAPPATLGYNRSIKLITNLGASPIGTAGIGQYDNTTFLTGLDGGAGGRLQFGLGAYNGINQALNSSNNYIDIYNGHVDVNKVLFINTSQNFLTLPTNTTSNYDILVRDKSDGYVKSLLSSTYQLPISLTTTGSSGASTFSSNILNVPTYTLAGLGYTTPTLAQVTAAGATTSTATQFGQLTATGELRVGAGSGQTQSINSGLNSIKIGSMNGFYANSGASQIFLYTNGYSNTSGIDTYIAAGHATSKLTMNGSTLTYQVAGTGTAGNPITYTTPFSVSSAGVVNSLALTASQLVATDASKNLVSVTDLPSGTTATTQSANDNSTKVATTAYVDAAATATAGFLKGSTFLAQTYEVAPTTGQTVSPTRNFKSIIRPTTALAALTISLPSTPSAGEIVWITITQPITTITYTNGTAATAPTTLATRDEFSLVYSSVTGEWH